VAVIAVAACASASAAGCNSPNGLDWRITFPDEAGPRPAVVEARILRGGCAGTDVVFRADILPSPPDAGRPPVPEAGAPEAGTDAGVDAGPAVPMDGGGGAGLDAGPTMMRGASLTPPALPPGTYGFAATGRDDTCHVLFLGCTQATLPAASDPTTIETLLAPVGGMTLDCGPALCDRGRCLALDAGPGATDGAVEAGRDGGTDACVPVAENCTNTVDDDCDGNTDCSDSDCSGDPVCDACTGVTCAECATCAGGSCTPLADDTGCTGGVCKSGSCCTGCWDGSTCQPGDTSAACGTGGGACNTCGCASDTCSAGSCGLGITAQSVATGASHACAVTSAGEIRCWGSDMFGQLGNGASGTIEQSPVLAGSDTDWAAVTAGGDHTCALKTDGSVFCWGANSRGALGVLDVLDRDTPTRTSVAGPWNEISAGQGHTCGILSDGTLWCWGRNDHGQAGAPAGTDLLMPTPLDPATTWTSIGAGELHSCGVRAGAVLCWGSNSAAQLGTGATDGSTHATPAAASTSGTFLAVTSGGAHSCALQDGGAVICWGGASAGQVGGGVVAFSSPPIAAGADMASLVSAGGLFSLAIQGGDLYTWGSNTNGELADPGATDRSTPGMVPDPTGTWATASSGSGFGCGVLTDGTVRCWGTDASGRLGNGSAGDSTTPVRVCF